MTAKATLRKGGEKLLLTVCGRRKARPARGERWGTRQRPDGRRAGVDFLLHHAREADALEGVMQLTAALGEYTLTALPLPDTTLPEDARYIPKDGLPASKPTGEKRRKARPNTLADHIAAAIDDETYHGVVAVPGKGGDKQDRADETWIFEWWVTRLDGDPRAKKPATAKE